MLRRATAIGLCAAVIAAANSFAVAVPEGPRLAVGAFTQDGMHELSTLGPSGADFQRVLRGRSQDSAAIAVYGGPVWSPDGETLAISKRGPRGRFIHLIPAGGGAPRILPGTRGALLPVFSPDGRSVAFTRLLRKGRQRFDWGTSWRFESAAVWLLNLETGQSRRLTRYRHHLEHYASSFSPDGTTLLVTRYDVERSGEMELVALRFDGRPSGLLVGEGVLPVYSPDGSRIALFRWVDSRIGENLELHVIDADGSRLQRLTHTPRRAELFASWDPSGERIAYTELGGRQFPRWGRIMQINADGSCRSKVLSGRGTIFFGPAWRPGPNRTAGAIEC